MSINLEMLGLGLGLTGFRVNPNPNPNIRILLAETWSQPLHFKMFRQQRSSNSFIDDTCDTRRVVVRLSMLYTSRAYCLSLS